MHGTCIWMGFRTAENHLLNILLKPDVKNTASLIRKVMETGLMK